ncbi:unnamed protein product [Dovyalis caffra]|uniref:Uncharacterized protein n=1 Tax=Dovyalis caffra TaxID=77055 RepID=A0AAV1SDH3_9ROSI|nr:unnamed protein product [Dovyalis caffra]
MSEHSIIQTRFPFFVGSGERGPGCASLLKNKNYFTSKSGPWNHEGGFNGKVGLNSVASVQLKLAQKVTDYESERKTVETRPCLN